MRRVFALLLIALMGLLATVASAQAIVPVPSAAGDAERAATTAAIEDQLGFGTSYALIIGISDFNEAVGWNDLAGVKPETEAIWKVLEEQHGFKVVGTSQASGSMDAAELSKRIREFVAVYGARPSNRLIIYIATHGYSGEDSPDGGYLIASNSEAPKGGTVEGAYSAVQFKQDLGGEDGRPLRSQHLYVFLDSCFSGSMFPQFSTTRSESELAIDKPVAALSEGTAEWTLKLLSLYARMMLTAGDSTQKVPDVGTPFGRAVVDALSGKADLDGDGLTLGSEIFQFVRSRVVTESFAGNNPNTPVYAVLPHTNSPTDDEKRPGAPADLNYALNGDFVFLTPGGPSPAGITGVSEAKATLDARRDNLIGTQFTECIGCPTMTQLPGKYSDLAMAVTETTYADWDACVRELGCTSYHDDAGQGRGDRPVGNITWTDAYQFVTWLNGRKREAPSDPLDPECDEYRLPTAEEWLFAALYDSRAELTWRNAVSSSEPICWGCGPGEDGTAAASTGSAPENAAHLYDMVGNLWEWVLTDADRMLDGTGVWPEQKPIPSGGDMLCETASIVTEGRCGTGVVMGGSYATRAEAMEQSMWGAQPRTDNRNPWALPTVGFRVACELKPTE